MNERLTIEELEKRWENVLAMTKNAVAKQPIVYRQIKTLASNVVKNPLDIREYFPTVERLTNLLQTMDPEGRGSIFHFFSKHISPTSIWQVPLLRMECRDLLSHLEAFDQWLSQTSHLKLVK
jgi:hypothetical protein